MTFVGIIFILFIILGGYIGWRKGALRELINLLGLIAIMILSFQFKDFIGTYIIRYMPFFDFGGNYTGILTANILFYQTISFLIVFLLLFCILNILINISGMVEVLDRITKVFEIPSKIAGVLFGALTSIAYIFLVVFVTLSIPNTAGLMMKDNVAMTIVKQTPVLSTVFGFSIRVEQKQYFIVQDHKKDEEGVKNAEINIASELVTNDVAEADLIQELIDKHKLNLENVTIHSAKSK